MEYMTRTHGFYSIYTNIQWNNCHFPTESVQMFQLVNVWNFATMHHLLQCSPICFSRTERRHIVHATLLLTCAQMCRSSLNLKTGHQTARILIRLIMQFGGIAADGASSQNFTHWPAETCAYRLLGSPKPGHIESSDRSAAKKTDDGHQGKGCPRGVSSGLTLWDNDSYQVWKTVRFFGPPCTVIRHRQRFHV